MSAPSENIELPDVPTVLGKRKWSDSDETDPVEDSDSDTNNYESQILGDYLSSSDQDDLENSDEDLEGSQSDADDDEDLDILEQEPEQGEVLWSEGEEEYPRCAIYNEKVNQHEHRLTEILNRLASRLAEITTQSESAERLHAQVIEAQQFPEPNAPLIALLGDAGTGKSALIGALTDTPFASKEGNFGIACTCVIVEYRKPFPEQTKKAAAKVEFLSHQQRSALLEEFLKNYITYYFEEDSDWTHDEKRRYHDQAKTAEGSFLDLFRGKPSFGTRDEMKQYLRAVFDNDRVEATVTKFEEWCGELATAHYSDTVSDMIEDDRPFQLNRRLGPFLCASASPSHTPSLWPIVHKVTIGIQGSRVLQHATVADLPGTSDVNQVRVRASKDYVRSSDHLWLVTPIGRCVTDTSVDTNLFTYGDRFSERLSIICTKTDDPMKPTEFKHAYPEHAKTLSELNKKRRDAQQLHTKAKAALKRARRPSTVEMCNTNVERYATKHAKARRNYLHYMMITRNKKIKALIYAEKSEYFKKGEREIIFPVSSKHYLWLKGYRDAEAEDDSPPNHNVTGIPMLRKHALRVPAPEMWSTFMTHTQHTLVGCIKALRIWASNISGIEGDTLSKVTNDSVKALERAKTVYLSALEIEAAKHLTIRMRETQLKVSRKAGNYMDEVENWHWTSIRAFIRFNGDHKTNAVGKVSWNMKMMVPAVDHLKGLWKDLASKASELLETMQTDVLDHIDGLKEAMRYLEIPHDHLEELLNAQKHGVNHVFERYRKKFDKQYRNVRQIAEKDDGDGYFAIAMRSAYLKAKEVTGTGYKNRVMDLLHDHVGQQGDDSPFVMIASLAAESIHRHASRLLEKLQEECRVVFHGMSERFGVIRDEAVDDDEAVAETKLGLRDYLVEVDDEIAKIIQSLKTIEKDDVRKAKPKSSPSHFIKQEDVEEASVLEPGLRPFKATKESDQQADGPGSAAQYDSPPNKKLKLSLKFKSEECEEKNSGE